MKFDGTASDWVFSVIMYLLRPCIFNGQDHEDVPNLHHTVAFYLRFGAADSPFFDVFFQFLRRLQSFSTIIFARCKLDTNPATIRLFFVHSPSFFVPVVHFFHHRPIIGEFGLRLEQVGDVNPILDVGCSDFVKTSSLSVFLFSVLNFWRVQCQCDDFGIE